MITFRELVSVMGDRDYYTISAVIIGLSSYFYFDLGNKTVSFLIISSIAVRLLSIENAKNKFKKLNYDAEECFEKILKEHNDTREPFESIASRIFSDSTLSEKCKQMVSDKFIALKKEDDDKILRMKRPFRANNG